MPQIAIVNETTVLTDEQVGAAKVCLQAQVTGDFYPHYGINAELLFWPKGKPVPPGMWELVFADDSDQAGALGYHETTANGDPIGFVFAKTDIDNATSWTVTASHELIEMLGDPDIVSVKEQDNSDGSMTFRMDELCDPCEDDSLAYKKKQSDGTFFRLPDHSPFLFSDFVLPPYWNPNAPPGSKFSFTGAVKSPLQILPGGYIGILQIPATIQWSQVEAKTGKLGRHAEEMQPGGKPSYFLSRRTRRARSDWKRSER